MEFSVTEVESIHDRDIIGFNPHLRPRGPVNRAIIFPKTLCGLPASQFGGEKTYMNKTEKMFSVFVLAAATVALSIVVAGCNSQPAQDNTAQNQAAQPAGGPNPESGSGREPGGSGQPRRTIPRRIILRRTALRHPAIAHRASRRLRLPAALNRRRIIRRTIREIMATTIPATPRRLLCRR